MQAQGAPGCAPGLARSRAGQPQAVAGGHPARQGWRRPQAGPHGQVRPSSPCHALRGVHSIHTLPECTAHGPAQSAWRSADSQVLVQPSPDAAQLPEALAPVVRGAAWLAAAPSPAPAAGRTPQVPVHSLSSCACISEALPCHTGTPCCGPHGPLCTSAHPWCSSPRV